MVSLSSDSFATIIDDAMEWRRTVPFVIAGTALLVLYAGLVFARWTTNWREILTQSQSIAALFCMALVAASVAGSMALTAWWGVKFNPMTTNVLPFLLLGLGVDDLFVIMCNFERPRNRSSAAALRRARLTAAAEEAGATKKAHANAANAACIGATAAVLAEIGPSITLTSFTNSAAFFIGRLTPLQACIDFSTQAAVGVLVRIALLEFLSCSSILLFAHLFFSLLLFFSLQVLYALNLFVTPAVLSLDYRLRRGNAVCGLAGAACKPLSPFKPGEADAAVDDAAAAVAREEVGSVARAPVAAATAAAAAAAAAAAPAAAAATADADADATKEAAVVLELPAAAPAAEEEIIAPVAGAHEPEGGDDAEGDARNGQRRGGDLWAAVRKHATCSYCGKTEHPEVGGEASEQDDELNSKVRCSFLLFVHFFCLLISSSFISFVCSFLLSVHFFCCSSISFVRSSISLVQLDDEMRRGPLTSVLVKRVYNPLIGSPYFKAFVLAVTGAFVVAAGVGAPRVVKGLSMIDVAPKGTMLNKFLTLRLEYFATYPFAVMTRQANYAAEDVQVGFAMLHNQIRQAPHVAFKGDEFYWMHGFLDWLRPSSALYPNKKCDASSLLTGGICGTSPNLPGQSATPNINGICKLTFPTDGRLPFISPSSFYRCLNLWINHDHHADVLLHSLPLYEPEVRRHLFILPFLFSSASILLVLLSFVCFILFYFVAHLFSSLLHSPQAPFGQRRLMFADGTPFDPAEPRGGRTGADEEDRELTISMMGFDAVDLKDDQAFIDLILEVQSVLARPRMGYGLNEQTRQYVDTPRAFGYGFPFAYWQQYIGLDELLLRNLTYSLLLAFGVVFTMLTLAALPPLCRAPAEAASSSRGVREGGAEAGGGAEAEAGDEGDAPATAEGGGARALSRSCAERCAVVAMRVPRVLLVAVWGSAIITIVIALTVFELYVGNDGAARVTPPVRPSVRSVECIAHRPPFHAIPLDTAHFLRRCTSVRLSPFHAGHVTSGTG